MGQAKKAVMAAQDDMQIPESVYQDKVVVDAMKILRDRGENELADMLEAHIDEAEACRG